MSVIDRSPLFGSDAAAVVAPACGCGKNLPSVVVEIEALRDRDALRHAVSVLGDECRPALEMQPARRAAVGARARFAEAALFALDDDVGGEKADQVGAVLDQRTCPLVQAELIAGVAGDARIIDGGDLDCARSARWSCRGCGAATHIRAGSRATIDPPRPSLCRKPGLSIEA